MIPALSSINAPLPNPLPVERVTDIRVTSATNSNVAAKERSRQTEMSNFQRLEFIEAERINQEIRQPVPQGESLSFYNRPLSAPFIPGSAEINPSELSRLPFHDRSAVDLTRALLGRRTGLVETALRNEPPELLDQGAVLDQNLIDQLDFQRNTRQQQPDVKSVQIEDGVRFIAPNLSPGIAQDADPATVLDLQTVREDGFIDFGYILSRSGHISHSDMTFGTDSVDDPMTIFSQFIPQSPLREHSPHSKTTLIQMNLEDPTPPVFNVNQLADDSGQRGISFAGTDQSRNQGIAGWGPAETQTQQNLDPNFDHVQTSFVISDAVPDSSVF